MTTEKTDRDMTWEPEHKDQARRQRRSTQDDDGQDVSHAEPIAECPPRDLENTVSHHESGHEPADM